MSDPYKWYSHPDVHATTVGGLAGIDSIEDTPYVTYEMVAAGPDAAEELAQGLVAATMREAGLEPRRMEAVWVAPLRAGDASSHRFLAEAKELFDEERYELAVVSAQIHLELQIRTLLELRTGKLGTRWATRLEKVRGISILGGELSYSAVELLLGVDVTQLGERWSRFKAHKARRDAVVHAGQAIRREDAASSIQAVQDLWQALLQASP